MRSTRVLLTCAALAAVGVVVGVPLAPFVGGLAAASPPAYALLAGVYGVMPLIARRLTGVAGTTTLTTFLVGLVLAAISPIGFLVLVPLLASALSIDGTLWVLARLRPAVASGTGRLLAAAGVSGVVLFAVSLPVFSPEDLAAPVLVATFCCRLIAQAAAAVVAIVVVALLRRAGVHSSART